MILKEKRNGKILQINGVLPSEKTIDNNSYPLCRDYYLAYNGELTDVEQEFMTYVKIVQGERNEKEKRLYDNIAFNDMYKLQFICLIGGRVCNPRQQQVAYSRLAREHT